MAATESAAAASSSSLLLLLCYVALAGHWTTMAHAETLAVCTRCPGKATSSAVVGFCNATLARRLSGRCCLSAGDIHDTILGLDLSFCQITTVEGLLDNASKAEVMDLSDNPLANISSATFLGFTSLAYIELPHLVECPGGNKAWKRIYVNHSRICQDQQNACNGILPDGAVLRPAYSGDLFALSFSVGHSAEKGKNPLVA
ncbi:all-trans retinoic acid-induced differentiation factor isoform X2 [Lampetra fluviatilis]